MLFVALALLVATFQPAETNRPPLELHPWHYKEPNQIFVSKSSSLQYELNLFNSSGTYATLLQPQEQTNIDEVNQIVDTFYAKSSLGTRCLDGHQIEMTKETRHLQRSEAGTFLDCEAFNFERIHNYTVPTQSLVSELLTTNYSQTKRSPDCDCSSGFPKCPNAAGGDINYRPLTKLRTKDLLYDLTSRNVSDWLLKTTFDEQFFQKRFGGFEFIATDQAAERAAEGLATSLDKLVARFNGKTRFKDILGQLFAKQAVRVWYNIKGMCFFMVCIYFQASTAEMV